MLERDAELVARQEAMPRRRRPRHAVRVAYGEGGDADAVDLRLQVQTLIFIGEEVFSAALKVHLENTLKFASAAPRP